VYLGEVVFLRARRLLRDDVSLVTVEDRAHCYQVFGLFLRFQLRPPQPGKAQVGSERDFLPILIAVVVADPRLS